MERRIITYYVVTAATAFVLPSLVTVFVVKELGAGLVAIAFTLVPVLTYLFALIFRLEVFDTFRAIGVGFGLCGALLIVFPESISSGSVKLPWMLALAIIPISLATSGIYRTIAWPESSSPLQLTIGMLLTSGIMLGLTMVGYGESFRLSDVDLRGLLVIGIQIIAAFISYLIFVRDSEVTWSCFSEPDGVCKHDDRCFGRCVCVWRALFNLDLVGIGVHVFWYEASGEATASPLARQVINGDICSRFVPVSPIKSCRSFNMQHR